MSPSESPWQAAFNLPGSRAPFLTRVMLRNYRSIEACDVELGPLTFLVGQNGSGKSNFLDALRLITDALRTSLDHALRDRGGVHEVGMHGAYLMALRGPRLQSEPTYRSGRSHRKAVVRRAALLPCCPVVSRTPAPKDQDFTAHCPTRRRAVDAVRCSRPESIVLGAPDPPSNSSTRNHHGHKEGESCNSAEPFGSIQLGVGSLDLLRAVHDGAGPGRRRRDA